MGFFDMFKREDEKVDLRKINSKLNMSFSNIKKDIKSMNQWINHLEDNRKKHKSRLNKHKDKIIDVESRLIAIENAIKELEDKQVFVNNQLFKQLSKQPQTAVRLKQTSVGVQTAVQTRVQTAKEDVMDYSSEELGFILKRLTVMERAVIWILLNTDLKLSYEDLAATLGKDKSTIRGQLNNIKRKSDNLVSEIVEKNGNKRYYIEDEIKSKIMSEIRSDSIEKKNKKKK